MKFQRVIKIDKVAWGSISGSTRYGLKQGRSQGEMGEIHPPETEKIVVEKWCYFRRLYFSNKFSKKNKNKK